MRPTHIILPFGLVLASVVGCGDEPPAPPPHVDAADTEGETDEEPDELDAAATEVEKRPGEVLAASDALDGELRGRDTALEERELAVAKRESSLDALGKELDGRLGRIDELEKRLEDQLGVGAVATERRDERTSFLAGLISTMSPQAAAQILSLMPDDDAQKLLVAVAVTNQRKAAKLISSMPPDRAAQIGQIYLDTDPLSVPEADAVLDGTPKPPAGPQVAAQGPAPEPKPEPPPVKGPAAEPPKADPPKPASTEADHEKEGAP